MQRDPISAATRTAIVALALFSVAPYTARSDWTLGAEAHVLHDDNVGNGESSPDIVEDTIVGARLSLFQLFALGEGYNVAAGGDLSGESFHRFDGLSNATAGGTLTLKKKWGSIHTCQLETVDCALLGRSSRSLLLGLGLVLLFDFRFS